MIHTDMPLYEGTKRLYAKPMTRGAYNDYRGWLPPEGEDQNVPGYLVEYVDGGEANDARHEGYISWSPADVFERHYARVDSGALGIGSMHTEPTYIRYNALTLAHNPDHDPKRVLERAKQYETFLTGGLQPSTPE